MTDTKHTPGPWEVKDGDNGYEIHGANIIAAYVTDEPSAVCEDANAHLIAAAPDLLNLCELVNDSFGGGRVITFSDSDIEDFVAAIAKAKGQTE